jgi:RNA polymerase sigma factor (sigma-70 family)
VEGAAQRRSGLVLSAEDILMAFERPPARPGEWEGGWPTTLHDYERLVEAFQDRLVRYAFRRLGNLHDAEDVAQEVLVRAYDSREDRRRVLCVRAYLYRMASNCCTDHLRMRGRRDSSTKEMEVMQLPSHQPDGLQEATAAEELRRIEALLRRIPARHAEVVRLRVLDELHLNEIAEVIGRPLPTVKSRLRYGLEKLRKIVVREKEASL